jgi:hypothetical protein
MTEEVKKRRGPQKDPKTGRFMKKEPVVMPPAPATLPDFMCEPAPVGEFSRIADRPKKRSLLSRLNPFKRKK